MSNFYETMLNHNLGRNLLKTVGLPTPIELKRYRAEQATFFSGKVLLAGSDNAVLLEDILRNLKDSDASVFYPQQRAAHRCW